MNNTVKLGLILGAISIATSLLYKFVLGFEFMFSSKSMIANIVITIIITILLARKMLRNPEEDRLGYGEAVKKLFIAYLISFAIASVFSVVMYSDDKEMEKEYIEYQLSAQEQGLKWGASMAGLSEADIESELEIHREKVASGEIPKPSYPYTWSGIPLMILIGSIMGILTALLLALFVREKETTHA